MPAAPTREIGQTAEAWAVPGSVLGWSAVTQDTEHVRQWRFPESVRTVEKMRTDSQVHGLWMAVQLTLRRYRWCIDPRDADPAVAQRMAEDLNLPLLGEKPRAPKRTKDRFSHDDHLRHALLAALYGFYFFEQVGRIDGTQWRLRKLAPRTPQSLDEIRIAQDGGLVGIKQRVGLNSPEIPVTSLVAYSWDREGGNWYGRSMLRPLYKHWLRKDELLRLDIMKHRRNAMGVPVAKATNEDVTPQQLKAAQEVASKVRAGEQSAAAMPYGLDLAMEGVRGSLTDIVESIRYDDQAMARAWLQMFAELGQTPNGSRALGTSLLDFYAMGIETMAIWYRDTTNAHVIEDAVDWNEGEDAEAPALVFEPNENSAELSIEQLATSVEKGLITVDPELEEYIRDHHRLPKRGQRDAPSGQSYAYDLDFGILTVDERRAQIGLDPLPDGQGAGLPAPSASRDDVTSAGNDPAAPPLIGQPTTTSTERAGRKQLYAEIRTALADPTPRRRQPYPHEVTAAVDFDTLDTQYRDELTQLLSDWEDVTQGQIDDLIKQVEDSTSLADFAAVAAVPVGAAVLATVMKRVVRSGASGAKAEVSAQGVDVDVPNLSAVDDVLDERAAATDTLLARSLSEAAGREAVRLGGGALETEAIAASVRNHLEGLSTAYLEQRLGGAVSSAQNYGRTTVFDAAISTADKDATPYGSELLDANTCSACAAVDGKDYDSLQSAMEEYPTGGYELCEGGERCRGTIVLTFEEA